MLLDHHSGVRVSILHSKKSMHQRLTHHNELAFRYLVVFQRMVLAGSHSFPSIDNGLLDSAISLR